VGLRNACNGFSERRGPVDTRPDRGRPRSVDSHRQRGGRFSIVVPAQIVAVLDQNSGLSADEIATKTSTDVETARSCTDQWRRAKTN